MKSDRVYVTAFAVFAALIVSAGDVASDIEITGVRNVEVPESETWTYSGSVSGSGSILKSGKGKLVLGNANTFSGGVSITNGVIEVAEQGALGSGRLNIVNVSGTPHVSVEFTKRDATVDNDIRLQNNVSNADNNNPHVYIFENTTLAGDIRSYANTFYMGNVNRNRNSIADAYPTNTVTGSLWVYGTRGLSLAAYGVTIFKGPVQVGYITLGAFSSTTGSLVLDTDSCNVNTYNLISASLYCKRRNVLNGAKLTVRKSASAAHVDLGGLDQTCSAFGVYSSDTSFPTSGTGYSIDSPDGPATLTVTGGAANASCDCYFSINDRITLLLDADPSYTCNFRKRANGTSGDIIVSNGVFSVTDTATFKAVPRIVVAEEGQLVMSSTESEALAGVTDLEVSGVFRSTGGSPFTPGAVRLVVGEGATFDAGTVVSVASFSIRGTDLDAGTYTHSDFAEIADGTTVVVPAQKRTVTWVGGGQDGLVATPANWSGGAVPDLTGGGLTAVFAEGGTAAVIDRMLCLDGIVFSGDEGFSLSRQGDAAGVTMLDAGLSFTAAAGNPERVFSLDVPLTAAESQLWTIPANTTFELRDGFTSMKDVMKGGDGNLVFSGTNTFAAALVITNGTTTFSGTITTPDGVDGSDHTMDNSVRCYGATSPGDTGVLTGRVFLDNAVIEKPFYTLGPNTFSRSTEYLWTTENSSNVIRGVWTSGGLAWQRLNQPDSAVTVFEGGIVNATRTYFDGGTVHIRNKPHISTANIFQITDGTRVIYEAAGGCIDNLYLGNATVEFRTSYSLSGGTVTNASSACGINLNCTTQRFDRICFGAAPDVVVDGGYGAALETLGNAGSVITADLVNEVSVINSGSGTLRLAGRTFSSAGEIVAASGTVEIADDARWKNVSRVCAYGDGTVSVQRSAGNLTSQAFGKDTEVHLSDEAVISIPDSSVQRVAYLFVDGVRQPLGDYTYAGIADGDVRKHFAQTTGTLKCIGNPGTVISIR